MVEAEDRHPLWSKSKAITALLPYAAWRERDGQPEMLDTILWAARASGILWFMWRHVDKIVGMLLSESSPRATVLASPHILRYQLRDMEDLVRHWIAAVSAAPDNEEIAQGVVDMLLQIASQGGPQYIPVDLWSWLTKRPSLPLICLGRDSGADDSIVEAVRALKDIEILKSYLLLVWSEWNTLYAEDFNKICTVIQEDFGGIGMGHHRTDLVQRLDHVLGQLDLGLEYFQQQYPGFSQFHLQVGENQYREFREILLEMNSRTSFADHALLYTDSYLGYVQDLVRCLCAHSLPRVHSSTVGTFDAPIPYFVRTSTSIPPA